MPDITPDCIRRAYETAKAALLAEMVSEPVASDDPVQKLLDAPVSEMRHWVGELSTSALSTATAVMALEQMRRQYVSARRDVPEMWTRLIRGGIEWLIAHQNADGGWGDTVKSISNISTTMLCHAVLVATREASSLPLPLGEGRGEGPSAINSPNADRLNAVPRESDLSSTPSVDRVPHPAFGHPLPEGEGAGLRAAGAAQAYIDSAGGVPTLIARYGKDRTFSVPILTHCALAGLVDWDEVISLPFELACIPARFYAAVRLPVVSYALPALIAIGQVRFHFRPSWNPLRRWLQRWAKPASLRVLERIQPPNGGFLEATPLTSFVTMSLAAMGLHDHSVAQRGIEFIVKSASEEWRVVSGELLVEDNKHAANSPLATNNSQLSSWPIDTNLATWVTTLSINALGDDVPLDARPGLRAWLLRQQYRVVHPYTNAAPGGWAWTDLPGGVPDADDTPGAMLALMNLEWSDRVQSGWHALSEAKGVETNDAPTSHALPDGQGVPPAVPRPSGSGLDSLGEPGGVSPRTRTENVRGLTPSGSPLIRMNDAVTDATRWLLTLQNRDGGWPTFCRGWGTLPFDRSSADITAHAIRALVRQYQLVCPQAEALWKQTAGLWGFFCTSLDEPTLEPSLVQPLVERNVASHAVFQAMSFLKRTQRPDGSWLPLWFGNQHAPNDENPTYGTAKVLAAFQALGRMSDESAVRGVRWLVENQNPDGGWGAGLGTPSSVEETALALEALVGAGSGQWAVGSGEQGQGDESKLPTAHCLLPTAITAGLSWLIPRVEDGRFREPSPIGFYFAKLWYFEALYPLIFTVAALRKAAVVCENEQ